MKLLIIICALVVQGQSILKSDSANAIDMLSKPFDYNQLMKKDVIPNTSIPNPTSTAFTTDIAATKDLSTSYPTSTTSTTPIAGKVNPDFSSLGSTMETLGFVFLGVVALLALVTYLSFMRKSNRNRLSSVLPMAAITKPSSKDSNDDFPKVAVYEAWTSKPKDQDDVTLVPDDSQSCNGHSMHPGYIATPVVPDYSSQRSRASSIGNGNMFMYHLPPPMPTIDQRRLSIGSSYSRQSSAHQSVANYPVQVMQHPFDSRMSMYSSHSNPHNIYNTSGYYQPINAGPMQPYPLYQQQFVSPPQRFVPFHQQQYTPHQQKSANPIQRQQFIQSQEQQKMPFLNGIDSKYYPSNRPLSSVFEEEFVTEAEVAEKLKHSDEKDNIVSTINDLIQNQQTLTLDFNVGLVKQDLGYDLKPLNSVVEEENLKLRALIVEESNAVQSELQYKLTLTSLQSKTLDVETTVREIEETGNQGVVSDYNLNDDIKSSS